MPFESDLRGIRVRGANISGAVIDNVVFSDADLRDVQMDKCWLANSDLYAADLDGCRFHERSHLVIQSDVVEYLSLSPANANLFVEANADSNVASVWSIDTGDTVTQVFTLRYSRDLHLFPHTVTRIA